VAKIAFAGAFANSLAEPARVCLGQTHEIVTGDEDGIISQLSDVDILVSLLLTREDGAGRSAPQTRTSTSRRA
jgi:hypothetical protein